MTRYLWFDDKDTSVARSRTKYEGTLYCAMLIWAANKQPTRLLKRWMLKKAIKDAKETTAKDSRSGTSDSVSKVP